MTNKELFVLGVQTAAITKDLREGRAISHQVVIAAQELSLKKFKQGLGENGQSVVDCVDDFIYIHYEEPEVHASKWCVVD